MLNDIKVGYLSALSSVKRGNRKTTFFIIFVLAVIFINLVFLPSLIKGMMNLFVGFVKDYSYGDVVVEPHADETYISNSNDNINRIKTLNGVSSVIKRLEAGASLKYKEKVVGANILGIIPSQEIGVSRYPDIVKYGEFLGELSRDEIMIGSMIAGKGSGSEIYDNLEGVEVGSLINVTYSNKVTRTYKVKGIHEGNFELSDLGALIHYKELESVYGIEDKASSIIVKVEKEGTEDEIKQQIIDIGVKERVYTWQEKAESLIKQAMQSIGILNIMSQIVSIIVGTALIFIIIYINILNRKREIGILKAIGISKSSIIISYVFISLFYMISGIILGLTIFLTLVFYLQKNPLVFYETLKVSPELNYNLLFQASYTMIIMSIIAGFLPAWFVTREDILKAIWGR